MIPPTSPSARPPAAATQDGSPAAPPLETHATPPRPLDGVATRAPQVGEPGRKRKREQEEDTAPSLPAESQGAKRRLLERVATAAESTPPAPAWDPAEDGAGGRPGFEAISTQSPFEQWLGLEFGSPASLAPRLASRFGAGPGPQEDTPPDGEGRMSPPVDIGHPDDAWAMDAPDDSPVDIGDAPPQALAEGGGDDEAQLDDADEAAYEQGNLWHGDPPLPVHGDVALVIGANEQEESVRYADIDMNDTDTGPLAKLVIARSGDGTVGACTDTLVSGVAVVFTTPGQVGLLHTTVRGEALRTEFDQVRTQFLAATGAAQVHVRVVFSNHNLAKNFDESATGRSAQQLAEDHGLEIPDAHRGSNAQGLAWLRQSLLADNERHALAAATALGVPGVTEAPWGVVLVRSADGSLDLFAHQGQEPTVEGPADPA